VSADVEVEAAVEVEPHTERIQLRNGFVAVLVLRDEPRQIRHSITVTAKPTREKAHHRSRNGEPR
jgi:hypothetical protein